MKHLRSEHSRLLKTLLDEAEVSVEPEVQDRLLRHLDWVIEQNATINLTAIRTPTEAVRLHVLDSLLVLPELERAPDGMMVDLGTGGGYPGVPLALASGRESLLLDSVGKKVRALEDFLRGARLEARIKVEVSRAEELGAAQPGRASVVVARAVTSLPSLVELASPLLSDHGMLVALKGPRDKLEVARADEAGKIVAMKLVGVREYTLPGGNERRSAVVFERAGTPEISLPRAVGRAQRRPLA